MTCAAVFRRRPPQRLPRRLLAEKSLPLFRHYADVIRRHGHGEEIILVVSNPGELGVAVFSQQHPRHRVIGMGGYLDTLRFRREIATELCIRRQGVQGLVLGQHGPGMVACFSTVSAIGFDSPEGRERIARLQSPQAIEPDVALREIHQVMMDSGPAVVFERLARFAPEMRTYLKPFAAQLYGAKTTLGTSEMIVRLVKTILSGTQLSAAAQVRLEGEFLGIHGVTGVPVVLSNVGVMRVEPLPLWPNRGIACCCPRDRCRASRSRSSVRIACAATSVDASCACPRWPERWSCGWRKETSDPSGR